MSNDMKGHEPTTPEVHADHANDRTVIKWENEIGDRIAVTVMTHPGGGTTFTIDTPSHGSTAHLPVRVLLPIADALHDANDRHTNHEPIGDRDVVELMRDTDAGHTLAVAVSPQDAA